MTLTSNVYTVCGLPGTGKSTVASVIISSVYGIILNTDVKRMEMYDERTYSEEETDEVYESLIEDAMYYAQTSNVVLDGTFALQRHRQMVLDAFDNVTFIKVVADEKTAMDRLRSREGVSEADADAYKYVEMIWEPLEVDHHVIDNGGKWAETRDQIEEILFEK